MKRLVLIAAALGVSVSAGAADDSEMKHSGELRLRYHNNMDSSGRDKVADSFAGFNHRIKLNTTIRKGENLQAMVSLIHTAGWGDSAGTTNSAVGTPDGTGDAQNMVLVNRAWGWWKSSDTLSFKFGRIGLEFADGSVISENDWEQVPTSHEGMMALWNLDFASIALIGVKLQELGSNSANSFTADPESNAYAVVLDFKNMPEALKMANLHFLQINTDESAGTNATSLQHFGGTVGGDTMNILYKATAAMQTGKSKNRLPAPATSTDLNGMMYDLMLGYQMPETMGLKITVGYHNDTGDKAGTTTKNEGYNPLFYDRHNYAGLMDVVGWGNLNYINLAVSLMPTDTIEAGLGYYMFSKTEAGAAAFGTVPSTQYDTAVAYYNGVGAQTADKELGSELDIWANKSYEGGFKIGARYGMFMPGKTLKNAAAPKGDKSVSELFLQASLGF